MIALLHRDRDGIASHTPLAEIPPGGPLIPHLEGIRPLIPDQVEGSAPSSLRRKCTGHDPMVTVCAPVR